MTSVVPGRLTEVISEEPGSFPYERFFIDASRPARARPAEEEINDQIAVWVNEGGAGGEVSR